MNDVLYKKSMHFINLPYPKIRLIKTSAEEYLIKLINDEDADFVINIDEDAFVFDIEKLKKLLHFIIDNEYVNCGMPDGGVVNIRKFNPLVTNPFFNILNVRKIRKEFSLNTNSLEDINSFPLWDDSYMDKFPKHLLKSEYKFINNEPYSRFFIWMSQNFKTLYLNAENHPDGESTILCDNNNHPFLIHTWYSRFYYKNTYHTKRIDNIIKECSIKSGYNYPFFVKDVVAKSYYINKYKVINALLSIKKKITIQL